MFTLPAFDRPQLLEQACTHKSFLHDRGNGGEHNERLEFLGDAILNFLCGIFLFTYFPRAPEGELTQYRALLVEREQLAHFAQELQLGGYLRLGKGVPINTRVLACAFEAIVGAYFLDQNQQIDRVRQFVEPFFLSALPSLPRGIEEQNVKGILQEWVLHYYSRPPIYETERTGGSDNAPLFTARVYIEGKLVGVGEGVRKQEAEKQAARQALARINDRQRASV